MRCLLRLPYQVHVKKQKAKILADYNTTLDFLQVDSFLGSVALLYYALF